MKAKDRGPGAGAAPALWLAAALLGGCPLPPPERPAGPDLRVEVVRSSRAEGRFGLLSLAVEPSGRAHLAWNDHEHQAVALAHLEPAALRIEFPVTRPSWMALGLELAGPGRYRIRSALQPRTAVEDLWDGTALEEQGRRELDEAAFGELRRAAARLEDSAGRVHEVVAAGPSAVRSDHPLFSACGEVRARPGWRISDRSLAAALGGETVRLLFVEQSLDQASMAVLRYGSCERGRWQVSTVGPAAAAELALGLDARGHPHIAWVRPREGGGEELVYATDAPPAEPAAAAAEGCPAGQLGEPGRCLDPRVSPALEACLRIEPADEARPPVEETPDGFRCLVLSRERALTEQALALSRRRCEAGEAVGCYLEAAAHDRFVSWMTFDPLLCEAQPGGTCMDHVQRVFGADLEHVAEDLALARSRYGRGCELGEPRACLRFASLALGSSRDDRAAYAAARPRCEAGHLAGCAMALEASRATEQEGREGLRARALALFEARCEGGSPSACTNLGYALARGEGGSAEPARALALFRRACEQGHGPACDNAREVR